MTRLQRIQNALEAQIKPIFLKVIDESHLHAGHLGHEDGAFETHYRVLVVSDMFVGASRIQRQRVVNDALKLEFKAGLHSLVIKTLTNEEFIAKGRPAEFE